MKTIEYLGRKLTAKTVRNAATGERKIAVYRGVQFFCYETSMTEGEALEMAKLYVDEAEKRPTAYPVLVR